MAKEPEQTIRWYAVHTGGGEESAADKNLRRRGYLTFYPFERVRRRRKIRGRDQHKVEWIEVPYFPRYLFVALRKDGETLYDVNETGGVSTVVYAGDRPLEVPHAVMDELMQRSHGSDGFMGDVDGVSRPRYRPGEQVTFVDDSPFAGLFAMVSIDKGKAVRIWLETLGRQREVSVPPEALKRA